MHVSNPTMTAMVEWHLQTPQRGLSMAGLWMMGTCPVLCFASATAQQSCTSIKDTPQEKACRAMHVLGTTNRVCPRLLCMGGACLLICAACMQQDLLNFLARSRAALPLGLPRTRGMLASRHIKPGAMICYPQEACAANELVLLATSCPARSSWFAT